MKKINIDRRKRTNKFNDASIMTVPWQKSTTRNFKQLINHINSISIHKINACGMKSYISKYNELANNREYIYRKYQDNLYFKKYGEHLDEEFE